MKENKQTNCKPTTEESWKASPENKQKINIEEAKFIFDQAEKLLKETVDVSQIIVSKTTTLITIVIGLLTAMTGFMIGKWENSACEFFSPITLTCLLSILYLIPICFILFDTIKTREYGAVGRMPQELFNDCFFDQKTKEKDITLVFYVTEIEEYQYKIENNTRTNVKRWKQYNTCLLFIALTPGVVGVIYFLTTLFY